ncbi:vesicle-mediated transporter Vid24 [Histoplasma capsulatum var. duboisii H88]|uniref:Vesicle-mediated transporter Vid24 n=1 Tax=Ajellomyces capsulatus (strain H88) TaxID=544711 RepID=F0UCT3_AJEC8|nr:vesicle-mediated transporter Vid24 [Histoplasma capsulatum var. duboisii H88]QSS49540.1 vesicle-mediated transporter Vid24 [Histoplasma capsulatum var. duboisii H88]
MPTPSGDPQSPTTIYPVDAAVSTHTTCPPETDRLATWRASSEERIEPNADDDVSSATVPRPALAQIDQPQNAHSQTVPTTSLGIEISPQSSTQTMDSTDHDVAMESPSPAASVSSSEVASSAQTYPTSSSTSSTTLSMDYAFSNVRLLPNHCSSFLRAGSKFVGTQQSDRQIYNVDVEIKHVDMAESYLCGYLRIQGLTEDHPTLTTYFEAEIIGTKYTFLTKHQSWGATDKTDLQHWARFPAWRPLARSARKSEFTYKNFTQHPDIFMRWKEYFLVPDHRVRTISGASFEGFYYICFNQIKGTVSGIYFHAKSEKYQQLELKPVENKGCFGAIEFR